MHKPIARLFDGGVFFDGHQFVPRCVRYRRRLSYSRELVSEISPFYFTTIVALPLIPPASPGRAEFPDAIPRTADKRMFIFFHSRVSAELVLLKLALTFPPAMFFITFPIFPARIFPS